MKRIAYASPVNPAPSGISDYSGELLPYLGQYADITLYCDDALRPSNKALAQHLRVRPLSRLEADQRQRPYDAIVYHMGNSPVHAAIWRTMQHVPGVVVLHEWVLHHFMLQIAAAENNIAGYLAEARERYGTDGERVAQLMARGRFTAAAFDLPFSERVLAHAEGLIAHSHYVTERAATMRPGLPMAHVPMGVPLPPLIERDAARKRLHLPSEALVLASFGHINPFKRIESVLRALPVLRAEHGDVRYLLVGSISPNYDLGSLVARMGMEDVVHITGYVERAVFEDYVAAADICINLRHPTAGETSASLLRLLGAGRPTLVTRSGSFTELPFGVAAQVDPDRTEGDLILAYCRLLARRPDIAAAMGSQARDYVAREHTLDGAAQGYMRFLAQLYGWGATPKLREPLWEVAKEEGRKQKEEIAESQRSTVSSQQSINLRNHSPIVHPQQLSIPSTALKAGVHHSSSVANLQSTYPSSLILHPLATALSGIGTTEDDQTLLRSVTQALAALAGAGDDSR